MTRLAAAPLLTPTEVAEHLRVTIRTLEQWRRDGNGPEFIRVGKNVRYEPDAVTAFKDANRTNVSEPRRARARSRARAVKRQARA